MENKLIYNAIRTPDGTILHSKYRHDYIQYVDKNGKIYGVDGGNEYLRRIGDNNDVEELSIYDDGKHSTRREYLVWGKRYDKNMNLLKDSVWIPIKDLETDHIKSIIDGGYVNHNKFYEQVFNDELEYRKNRKD